MEAGRVLADVRKGLEYTLGWVDPGPPPLEPLSDTLRLVTPSLTFPNYTVRGQAHKHAVS